MPEVCPRAIALAQSGRVKLSPLATHRFSLDEVPAAFEQQVARRDGIVKAIIYP
jgi:L-iditol 2-dehydrogenase